MLCDFSHMSYSLFNFHDTIIGLHSPALTATEPAVSTMLPLDSTSPKGLCFYVKEKNNNNHPFLRGQQRTNFLSGEASVYTIQSWGF